ncbi:MAG: cob(I)yrinic acid a,c-diamide adenosyltransferase [Chloroflexota bacterium]
MTPRFYTKTGDDGTTGLLGGGRVPKHHPRPRAFGAIDEASAAIGIAKAASRNAQIAPLLTKVQRDLYHIMSEVAATPENAEKFRRVDGERVSWLEGQVDSLSTQVKAPEEFTLPGDTLSGAYLALARTIVRRAERQVVALYFEGELENPYLHQYLNRLSSLCYVLELLENQIVGGGTPTLAKEG